MISKKRIKRLYHEAVEQLQCQERIGQSKHIAKQAMRNAGLPCNHLRGIYAVSTAETYRKQILLYIRWLGKYDIAPTHWQACRWYAADYIRFQIAAGHSAWTVRLRAAALCSAFGGASLPELGFTDPLPIRTRTAITRTRCASSSASRFQAPRFNAVRRFITACGCRRGGALSVCRSDFITDDKGQLWVTLKEKGGKIRKAPVLPEEQAFVYAFLQAHPETGPLLTLHDLPTGMAVHHCRGEYARRLYAYYAADGTTPDEKLYHGRKDKRGQSWDKAVLRKVSEALGHSRLGVVVSHYL